MTNTNTKTKTKTKMMMIENKESFQARIKPYFSPSDTLDIYHAYYLAKYGHRGQVRSSKYI